MVNVPELTPQQIPVLSADAKRRQKMRNVAIGLCLAFLVVAFYVQTIVQLASNLAQSHH